MSLITEKLDEVDYSLWNDFINQSLQGSFFYTTEWANLLSYTFNRQYEIIVLRENEQIIAGMLIFVQIRFGFHMITPMALYPNIGPVLKEISDAKYQKSIARKLEILTALTKYLHKNFDFWMFNVAPEINDVRSFQWQNCSAEPSYTYRVDLGDWGICEQNFNQSVRKKVRQAERENISFIQSDDKNDFMHMYSSSYHRHGIKPLIEDNLLEKFLSMALKLPQVKLYYVVQGDKKLAGRIILEDKNRIFDLLAGSDDPAGYGSTYLVYHIFKRYSGKNLTFDFLGADHPGIEEFKRGFGGDLVNGYRISSPAKFPLSVMLKMRTRSLQRNRKL